MNKWMYKRTITHTKNSHLSSHENVSNLHLNDEERWKIGIIFWQLVDIDYKIKKHQIFVLKKINVSFLTIFGNCNKNVKNNHNQQWGKNAIGKKWKN